MSVPSVLFITTCEQTPENLIKKVINTTLPAPVVIDDNISAYNWHIDNKYYTSDISLCAVQQKSISSGQFANSVDGLVIIFDATNNQSLELVESWLPFVDCYDAEIKMLVCSTCNEDEGVNKRLAQEWCIEKRFELIELDPIEEIDPDDDFPETTGVARIVQALNAHQWSNLVLKSEPSRFPNSLEDLDDDDSDAAFPGQLAESLEEMLGNDSFGDLFSQLAEMKDRVGRLSGQARQDAAEEVVRAFWNALGGDQDDL